MDAINARQAKIPLSIKNYLEAFEEVNYNNGFFAGFVTGASLMAVLAVATFALVKK